MKCDDYQLLIHDFLENELDKENQKLLFAHLSECENCAKYLTTTVSINSVIAEDKNFFPASLDERIFEEIPEEKASIFTNFFAVKLPAYFAYALVAIVLLLSFTLLSEVNKYKDELHQTSVQLKEQKRTVELLFNSLPTVEVHPVSNNNL
ncbi:MAG: anti-sigma factor [Ignavibacteriaceae bacterium]|jgi:predicted anti-sigma-YlaC factor YlaD